MKTNMIGKTMFSIRKLIIIIAGIILFKNVNATGQVPDFLIVEKDTFYLFSNPLETYLEFKNTRTINGVELNWTNTVCWRGYIATWEIRNDSLFLVKIIRDDESGKFRTFNLKEEFGTNKVFVDWYTGTLFSPRGKVLQYDGYSSIYEFEEYYKVWNGQVKSSESMANIVYNKNQLFPAYHFLIDTLKRTVKSKLNKELLNQIPDSSCCFLNVQFNNYGKVEKVELRIGSRKRALFENSILRIAEEEFIKLPPLMKVTHKYYQPPHFDLWFDAYCIKNPWDKLYGCKY